MSGFNELLHGSAKEAADYLHYESDVTNEEVRAALTNALNKIDRLERTIEKLQELVSPEVS